MQVPQACRDAHQASDLSLASCGSVGPCGFEKPSNLVILLLLREHSTSTCRKLILLCPDLVLQSMRSSCEEHPDCQAQAESRSGTEEDLSSTRTARALASP